MFDYDKALGVRRDTNSLMALELRQAEEHASKQTVTFTVKQVNTLVDIFDGTTEDILFIAKHLLIGVDELKKLDRVSISIMKVLAQGAMIKERTKDAFLDTTKSPYLVPGVYPQELDIRTIPNETEGAVKYRDDFSLHSSAYTAIYLDENNSESIFSPAEDTIIGTELDGTIMIHCDSDRITHYDKDGSMRVTTAGICKIPDIVVEGNTLIPISPINVGLTHKSLESDNSVDLSRKIEILLNNRMGELVINNLVPDSVMNAMDILGVSTLSDENRSLVLLINSASWLRFLNGPDFLDWFDPATRYEMLHRGDTHKHLGINLSIITDFYMQNRVLSDNMLINVPSICNYLLK